MTDEEWIPLGLSPPRVAGVRLQASTGRNHMVRRVTLSVPMLLLSACATTLEPGASKVQVVTASQKEQLCKSLGVFSVEQRVGPNKPANAMNKALNEVLHRGGNGIYPVSNAVDWAEGASVTGEALKCQFVP